MRKRNYWRVAIRSRVQSLKTYATKRLHNLTPRQRIISICTASVLLFVAVVPAVYQLIENQRYRLDDKTLSLIGDVNQNLATKLTYDQDSSEWRFNASKISSNSTASFASLKAQVGGGAQDETLYATTFAQDPSEGVAFYDTQTQQSFRMVPEFSTKSGKSIDGRLVYPMQGGAKLIYTPKNNGMKEDIVLPRYISNELTYNYKLSLPKTLKAQIQEDGSVGIFSADPMLFGDVATSEDSDTEKLRSAREDGDKNHLLFAIPAPVIVQSSHKQVKATARFSLVNDTLTVTARDMNKVSYPASIDPSIVVTSSSDFAAGSNAVDNINMSVTDRVYRATGKASTFSGFNTTTALPSATNALAAVLYNNRIYTIGGSSNGTAVYYSTINPNGTLGSWQTTTSATVARTYAGAAAYNGYLYVWGGYNTSTNTATTSVEYAKINADGTLGPWQTTTNMQSAVCRAGTAAYNGYLYSIGGSTSPDAGCTSASTGATNTIQYAPINPNGTVGSWQTTTNTPYGSSGAVIHPMTSAYNGFMYIAGGHNNGGGTAYSNVQYAAINEDGTLSSWTATTSLPAGTHSAGFAVQEGFITTLSNQSNSTTQYYAPVYANGQVGSWSQMNHTALSAGRSGGVLLLNQSSGYYIGGSGPTSTVDYSARDDSGRIRNPGLVTTSFTTGRERMGVVAHKGCLIVAGGYGGNSNTYVNYAQSAPINNTGNITTSWPNKGFSTSRADLAATAYNGYLYILGGYNANTGNYYNDVQYVAINDDCTLGTWSSTSSFDTSGNARGGISATIHNGYMYVTGGKRNSTDFDTVRYAPINPDGTVGSWSDTTKLPAALNRHRTIISGNRMYLLGGTQLALPNVNNGATTGSRPTGAGSANVYFATIASDGTLGTWQQTADMPVDLYEFGATAYGGYIYTAGGFTSSGTGTSGSYYYARINTDGTLTNWILSHTHIDQFGSVSLVENNGYLYAVSGRSDDGIGAATRGNTTRYVPAFNSGNGRAGNWTSSDSLSSGRTHAASTAYNGHMYTVGGSTDGGSTPSSTIERSTITPQTGAINNFVTDSNNLATGVMSASATAYDGYLYVVGGKTATGHQNAVQYAPIGPNGTLSDNFATTTGFTTSAGREGSCVTTYKGRMYVVGGWDGTNYYNDVRYAAFNQNGTLSNWSDSGSNFSTARSDANCTVAGGRLYVFGGKNASDVYNDVQYATINSDGSLGTWTHGASFMGARSNFIAGYSNGFLYIHGGCSSAACSGGRDGIQYTQVNVDGSLEPWQSQSTSDSPYRSTGLLYRGYLYRIGGLGVSAGTDSTAYTPLATVARIGHYSKLIDLGTAANINSISIASNSATDSIAPTSSRATFRSALDGGSWRSGTVKITDISQNTDTCDTSSLSYARYILVSVTLDDTYGLGFADAAGSPAHIAGITVDYTPNRAEPNQRLARGKFFKEGSLQSLDTCG